jgi:hypothetical protein
MTLQKDSVPCSFFLSDIIGLMGSKITWTIDKMLFHLQKLKIISFFKKNIKTTTY